MRFKGCRLISIFPVVLTVEGLKVMVTEERVPGDNVTAEKESLAEKSLPISRMKGEVVIAGVGFVIDERVIMISEIGESERIELVMMILLLGLSTTQPKPVTKLKLYATRLQFSEPVRVYSAGKITVRLEPAGTS